MHELPVSFPQQRLWLLDRVEPGSPAYNIARAFRLRGPIDTRALAVALRHLVRRHDALRTTFIEREGLPLQVVHDFIDVPLRQEDLRQLPEEKREQAALKHAAEEARRPFDLTQGPLLRTVLLKVAPEHHVFVLTMHHIVTDGWSMGILFSDLAALYDAELTGRPPALKALPVSYADFAAWQREFHDADAMRESLDYWRQALAGAPQLLELPTDRPRPASQGPEGHTVRFTISEDVTERLKALAESQGATLYMALLAMWQVLLARYSGADEVVVGSPLAGRTEVELEAVVGFFVNTVALRTSVADDPTVDHLLARVRATCLDAWSHQQAPFERVVEVLAPDRGLAHSPIVQAMFILQNLSKQHLRIGPAAAAADELDFDSGVAKADVTLEIFEHAGLQCSLEYRRELFDEPRMLRMARHFERLVDSAVANPAARVSELEMLTDDEREAMASWNATDSEYARDVSLAALFHVQAARTPFRTALVGPERQVTFARLRAEAVATGARLEALGVRPGDRVAVCLERSVDAVAAILGVLDAGGVVVPIDPAYPPPRIAFMLEDSRAAAVVSREAPAGLAAGIPVLDPADVDVSELPRTGEEARSPGGDSPAYVIYTSGSAGTPKGVIGTHRGAVNRLHWMWRTYPFESGEVCVHKTALSFVDSVAEIFGGLLQGVPTVVLGDEAARDAVRLAHAIEGHHVTRLVLVPSLLHALLEHVDDLAARLRTLRICVTSGEELPLALFERVRTALPHVRVLNLYGSSEVAADVTCFDADRDAVGGSVPIGRPIDNTRIHILDRRLKMAPIGVPGEICVAGDGVALGYHQRPDLTDARFVQDPFGPPGARLFKTGDLGCYRADGQIDYLGRIDQQVKLRGMRVELGEIEATLEHHPSVEQAVVVLDANGGEPRLVAYVVSRSGMVLVPATLRRFLRQQLPEHMVPAAFVALDALPLMPNGKIDRKRLPAAGAEASTGVPYVAPKTDTEVAIAEIWSQVLRVGRVGTHERFFDLGGHSLLAMQVLARIRNALDVDVSLRALFDDPTVSGLAAAVEEARHSGHRARTPRIVPRRSKPNRAALLAQLESMSDEEVDALLEAALARRADAAGA